MTTQISSKETPRRRDKNNAATLERARKRIGAVANADSLELMREDYSVALGWIGALFVEGLLDKEKFDVLEAELDKVVAEWDDAAVGEGNADLSRES